MTARPFGIQSGFSEKNVRSYGTSLASLTGGTILKGLSHLPPVGPASSGGASVGIGHVLLCIAAAAFLIASLK